MPWPAVPAHPHDPAGGPTARHGPPGVPEARHGPSAGPAALHGLRRMLPPWLRHGHRGRLRDGFRGRLRQEPQPGLPASLRRGLPDRLRHGLPGKLRHALPDGLRHALRNGLRHGPTRPALERRVALALAVAVAVVGCTALAVGLTTPAGDGADRPGDPVAGGAPTGVPDGASAVDPAAYGADALEFRSPSGNIECRMADDGTRCTIGKRGWAFPPSAPDCPRANGTVVLSGSGAAFASCEPAAARSSRSLGYDRALRRGDVACVSRRDGVECRDDSTGHGFAISRAEYRVY